MRIELTYAQQQQVLANDIWFDVLITYWNDDNDDIKEVSFITQYPGAFDIQQKIYDHGDDYCGGDNLKEFGGDFDNYEVTKIRPDHRALFYLNFEEVLVD
jgi:hypothetical protein